MWGTHVEAEVTEARNSAKDDRQRRNKVMATLRRLMEETTPLEDVKDDKPKPVIKGQFRDPAAMFKGGQKIVER